MIVSLLAVFTDRAGGKAVPWDGTVMSKRPISTLLAGTAAVVWLIRLERLIDQLCPLLSSLHTRSGSRFLGRAGERRRVGVADQLGYDGGSSRSKIALAGLERPLGVDEQGCG